ncbi:chorismate mutase [Candidatus Pacearchaeota archaeon]|nr:chorismate mutase [Candidatus Pacearchaeota archaeon]
MDDNLSNLRKQIDKIDNQLLILIKQRFDVALEVADYKREHNLSICVPERENEVIKARTKQAVELGMEDHTRFIQELFQSIMRESRLIQETCLAQQINTTEG